MPHDFLQTTQEIFEQARDSITSQITELNNFTAGSFNAALLRSFSQQSRTLQELLLVSELAGFIDFVGGPVTEDDLERIGVNDQISAERVNELMKDEFLDEYVKIVGLTRDDGNAATGRVNFTTSERPVTIPAGTELRTLEDPNREQVSFLTTEEATTAQGEVLAEDVSIEATEVGEEGNVPANTITSISNPPVAVRTVTNNEATTGGEPVETNAELRERAKNAISGASEGGTVQGIKSFIRNNVEAVRRGDVIIDESTDTSPPTVDVIVDGGIDSEVESAIEFSRPTGIQHELIRPQVVQIGADISLRGDSIDTADVEQRVEDFLLDLGIGEEFFEDQIIREIMLSDNNIINIDEIGSVIERSTNERFTFESGKTEYRLDYTYEEENGTISITDDSTKTYTEGTNYEVVDNTRDGLPETISWNTGLDVAIPNDGTKFSVDYDTTVLGETKLDNEYKTRLKRDEKFTFSDHSEEFDYNNSEQTYKLDNIPFKSDLTLIDENNTEFLIDESWQLAPIGENAVSDTFTFDETKDDYSLSEDLGVVPSDPDSDCKCAITDENLRIYQLNVDYDTINTDGDTFDDTISWGLDVDGAVLESGTSQTIETAAANDTTADDITLLPSSPSVGDNYNFGFDTDTFDGLVLDVSTTSSSNDWTIVWEYWNGSSWEALNGVVDETNGFTAQGRGAVEFDKPADWQRRDVASITGLYWIRARLDSVTTVDTQPLGKEVDIGTTPDNGVDFTTNYNGFPQTIRWDQSGSDPQPPQDSTVTATYRQEVYPTEQEIVETENGEITDASGNQYFSEKVPQIADPDFDTVDVDRDGERDAIRWFKQPATLSVNEEFFLTYIREGDVDVSRREKIDPGTITVSEL